MQGAGVVSDLVLTDGSRAARLSCPSVLVPAPGQYAMAHDGDEHSALATAVFSAQTTADGFLVAPPSPQGWVPGTRVYLRGPLGTGFALPRAARRVALIAFNGHPWRLQSLLEACLRQDASVTLVCERHTTDLPLELEVQPLSALREVFAWADYAALDVERQSIAEMRAALADRNGNRFGAEAQVLVFTAMPCGALGECGVCTIRTAGGPKLACEQGPVFDLRLLLSES